MSEDKRNKKNNYRGRLAPTPSGFLHQGHIKTFRTAWQRAKQFKGELIFRMDDLDEKRCREKFYQSCLEDCRSMGLDWNEGPDIGGKYGPYRQSQRKSYYLEALQKLKDRGVIYPCLKSRSEIRDQAILSSGGEYLFPKHYRPSKKSLGFSDFPGTVNWRFFVPGDSKVKFFDLKDGPNEFTTGIDFSDFLVWRKEGGATYELATVVDDHLMNISEIVRGEDLKTSSARQCLVFDALGWRRPSFYHCKLLYGDDGKKLSKSSRLLPRLFATD